MSVIGLCKNCEHLRTKTVGHVSSRSYCNLSKGEYGKKLGVIPWADKQHPKCPLKEGNTK